MPPGVNKRVILIGGLVLAVVVIFVLVSLNIKTPTSLAPKLTVWGIDKPDAFDSVGQSFKAVVPGSEIKYIQVPTEGYEDALLKALAAGQGPDVMYISNRSLSKLKDILLPADPQKINTTDLSTLFPTVAGQDFVYKNSVYALPLYMDNLVLLYNMDIFDKATIVTPPATWSDFQNMIPKLRILNTQGQLSQAAAAIGGTEKSVSYATDILNLLMLQNGSTIVSSDRSSAKFTDAAGNSAFNYYLQFSNPASPSYTWNEAGDDSLDSFAAGKTAMVFAYQSDIAALKQKNPFLKIGIAPVPQVSANSPIAYPSYGGLAVAKQGKPGAWDFVKFAATDQGAASAYLKATKRLPALRSFIAVNLNDPNYAVFAKQALIARSWPIPDYDKIKDIFSVAISKVLTAAANPAQALREAQDSVSLILVK